jgi:O-acetylserine/cysteine efflux transporter
MARWHVPLVALLAAIDAVCYAAIKAGLPFAPPLRFAGLRAVIGGVALLAALRVAGRDLWPARRLWPWIAALSLTGTVIGYAAMFASPGRTGAGLASVLGNTGPLILVVLARLVLGESLSTAKVTALIFGFAGVSLIAYPAIGAIGALGAATVALPLLAAMGTASESVIFKRADAGSAFLSVAAWQLIMGGGVLLALSGGFERGAAIVWSPAFVALLLFLGLVGTGVALATWYWLVQREEVGRLGLLLFLVPVLGFLVGILTFGEPVRVQEVVGVGLTVTGLGALVREWFRGRAPSSLRKGHDGTIRP